MTLIEFFEKDAIENICSSLVKTPERVVLIGDRKAAQKHMERYKVVLSAKGVEVDFIYRTVNKNRMQSIIDILTELVEEYNDCVFDLTGGDELCLAATGIVCERYKDLNLQMHRINVRNNTIIDADQDGVTIMEETAPLLSIEENIRIYGGDIVYDEDRDGATFRWDMSDDFKRDINAMWEICRQDVRLWNTQMIVLEAVERFAGEKSLTVTAPADIIKVSVERNGGKYVTIRRILDGLRKAGILLHCEYDDEIFSITYKNEQVKSCLVTAGQVLEMKVYLAALEAKEKDGTETYNDVMNGVIIDWDGDIHTNKKEYDTENEIDVMMMHGMVPVFVSCKNGFIEKDELYKLNTVANRFGGKYAKKVLVATALDNSDYSNFIRQRAEDMNIRLIEGYVHKGFLKRFTELNDNEINSVIRTLWSS